MNTAFLDALEALAERAGDTAEAVVLWTLLGAIKLKTVDALAQMAALHAAQMMKDAESRPN